MYKIRINTSIRPISLLMLIYLFLFGSCLKIINAREFTNQTISDFGAIGDGKTDDYLALQKAVDAGIREIYLPAGIYRITKTILVDLDRVGPISIFGNGAAKIFMEGSGPVFKIIGTHEGSAYPPSVKDNVWESQRMPIVDGLEIVGSHPKAVGIELTGTFKATLTRILIRKVLHGIHLTNRNRNIVISDCHIYDNRGIGVFLDHVNLHQINITNCHISYNGEGGIVAYPGQIRNLQVGNCDIEGNMNPNGPSTANVLIDLSQSTETENIGELAIVGCTIQHTHNAANSANIRFIGRPEGHKAVVENFTIANNILSDVAVNIHLKYTRSGTITGNTFWKGYTSDLLIENSSFLNFASNVFDRNPSYNEIDPLRGLVFRGCMDCILSGLQINNTTQSQGGLVIEHCRRFTISNCSVLNCDGCGIFMKDVENVQLSQCGIYDNRIIGEKPISICLIQGKNNMVTNNICDGKLEVDSDSAYLINNFTNK